MKLRHFLDAAYAILFEEYQRYKMSLWDATKQLREYASGYDPTKPVEEVPESASPKTNDQAMNELRGLFANTGIAF